MRYLSLFTVVAAIAGAVAAPRVASAQVCGQVPDTLIVFDRSGSMKERAATTSKWSAAAAAVNTLTSGFAGQLAFGFMFFPRWPHVAKCSTGSVNIAPGAGTASAIGSLLSSAYPTGDTPSSNSLNAARSYLRSIRRTGRAQYVLLITDGKETCSPNWPNTATRTLLSDGVRTYVIGFGSSAHAKSLNDAAIAGGTGRYYQANNLTQLNSALLAIAAKITCCGNGKVDPGEVCDPKIPAGAAGACPTTCDDRNACTTDYRTGKACQVRCSYARVTVAKSGDGCCPPGATRATDTDCPLGCGNGVVDAGERCDTAIAWPTRGACPTTAAHCDDKDPKTTDFIVASGCQAFCSHANKTVPPACGNGIVEPGEWCDTKIPAGQPGACPVKCDDGNKCTEDLKLGTLCLQKCAFVPITTPKNNDGCCPPGATSATDNDCSKACGNGVLDPGETCDPGIKSGRGVCISKCDDKNRCTKDLLGGSACHRRCGFFPPPANRTKKDGCCPAGLTSYRDADCLPPCGPDRRTKCVNPCLNVRCKDGFYCKIGKCAPWPGGAGQPGGETGKLPPTVEVRGGCDCQVGAGSATGGALAVVALIVVGLARPSRRRRRS